VVENRIDWFLIVAGVCRLMLDAPFCTRHEPERADGRKAAACFLPWHKSTRRPHERDIIVKMHNTKDCLGGLDRFIALREGFSLVILSLTAHGRGRRH
jgi:hypothetical protein